MLPAEDQATVAIAAEEAGLFGVMVDGDGRGSGVVVAAGIAARTFAVRIVVLVRLDSEHPVTLAEELAVLDNISNGRLIVAVDPGQLTVAQAAEAILLVRECWSGRPVRHRGPHWRVPANLPGHEAPRSIVVTPKPAQIEPHIWLGTAADSDLAELTGLPVIVTSPLAEQQPGHVQPGRLRIAGDAEIDRPSVTEWADRGATHLLLDLDEVPTPDTLAYVARSLVPVAMMPGFPEVVAELTNPLPWPSDP